MHNGIECPEGHYCGVGATEAIPCPIGTYNPVTKGEDEDACLLCDTKTFSDTEGAAACYPCGANGESEKGSATCICVGKYRHF